MNEGTFVQKQVPVVLCDQARRRIALPLVLAAGTFAGDVGAIPPELPHPAIERPVREVGDTRIHPPDSYRQLSLHPRPPLLNAATVGKYVASLTRFRLPLSSVRQPKELGRCLVSPGGPPFSLQCPQSLVRSCEKHSGRREKKSWEACRFSIGEAQG